MCLKITHEELLLLNYGVEKTLESPLDCKKIQPVHPKGNQSWIFIERTDAETETTVLWPPDVKKWLIWKDPDAGEDWKQEEKGITEDEMVEWLHRLDGYEFEWTPVISDGQGSLGCCSPWGPKESDLTEWLNWGKKELLPRLRPGMQCKLLLIVPAGHFALYPTCPVFIFFPCFAFRAHSGVFWKLTVCPEALFSENGIELAT